MSTDFTGRESDKPITEQEGAMFAAQPVWERSRKRKGFGGRRAVSGAPSAVISPEPRSFAAEPDDEEPMVLDQRIDAPRAASPEYPRTEYAAMNPGTTAASTLAADDDAGLVAPIAMGRANARSTRAVKSSSAAPAAIAAAVVGLGALGAAGWYMSRDTPGVPELTPGATTSEVAAAPLTPTEPPAQMAMNEAPTPPAATPPAMTQRAEPARAPTASARTTTRARPAATAPNAGETGVNASATAVLPNGPQPYSSVSPGPAPAAPTQANPPLVVLPPSSEAPAAVPATPPTLPQEAPATEAPTPDTTATPPQ